MLSIDRHECRSGRQQVDEQVCERAHGIRQVTWAEVTLKISPSNANDNSPHRGGGRPWTRGMASGVQWSSRFALPRDPPAITGGTLYHGGDRASRIEQVVPAYAGGPDAIVLALHDRARVTNGWPPPPTKPRGNSMFREAGEVVCADRPEPSRRSGSGTTTSRRPRTRRCMTSSSARREHSPPPLPRR